VWWRSLLLEQAEKSWMEEKRREEKRREAEMIEAKAQNLYN
jgi:hypothetical protein